MTNEEPSGLKPRVRWLSVVLFYAIACGISWPYFWWRDMHRAAWDAWACPGILKGWIPALGPALGAAFAMLLVRRQQKFPIRLLGTAPYWGFLFAALPLLYTALVSALWGDGAWDGLQLGLAYLVYACGEEYGWLGGVTDVSRVVRENGHVAVYGRGAVLARVASALAERGVVPEDLRSEQASLEDVFLALTGTSIRD